MIARHLVACVCVYAVKVKVILHLEGAITVLGYCQHLDLCVF